MQFIFMLTHSDRTVTDALEVYGKLRDTDLHYVGFKDVGVDRATLQQLVDTIHADDRPVMLEVVSTSAQEELRSIAAAVDVGVDYVLGGTHVDAALEVIGDANLRYCPFPGRIVGHPSVLEGTLEEIVGDAKRLTAIDGVSGLDLLAYRHASVDPTELTRAVVEASDGPVIAAGSVDREERIRALADAGAWAFTIGSAIFDGQLPGAPDIAAQVRWVLEICEDA